MTAARQYSTFRDTQGSGALMALASLGREEAERIGLELRRARKRRYGLRNSLNKAAEVAGVSIALLSMIERGHHALNKVRPETLERMPEAYGLKVQEFSDLTGITLVRPNDMSDIGFNVKRIGSQEYVHARINLVTAGTILHMLSESAVTVTVPAELAAHTLGGLVIDRAYVSGVSSGSYCLWSDRAAEVGQLVVVEKAGCQYPAFLLAGDLVEVDTAIDQTTPLRFRPDRIIGVVEEIRLLEVPRRGTS